MIIKGIDHLTQEQKTSLDTLLTKYEGLFDGNIGTMETAPVSLELKQETVPYHGKPYPVLVKDKGKFKSNVQRLENLGI